MKDLNFMQDLYMVDLELFKYFGVNIIGVSLIDINSCVVVEVKLKIVELFLSNDVLYLLFYNGLQEIMVCFLYVFLYCFGIVCDDIENGWYILVYKKINNKEYIMYFVFRYLMLSLFILCLQMELVFIYDSVWLLGEVFNGILVSRKKLNFSQVVGCGWFLVWEDGRDFYDFIKFVSKVY